MTPQTMGALAAFLALVAPGIVFELRRERRRARRAETAFREAARVALGSLAFGGGRVRVAAPPLIVIAVAFDLVLGRYGLDLSGKAAGRGAEFEKKVIGDTWHRVVLPGSKITYVRVCCIHRKTAS